MRTFQQIGKACGGLIKAVEDTKLGKNLIEAKLKIRYNYSGFLPANIKIFYGEGNNFSIQTISHSEGKWLIERDVQLHSTFKRQAAAIFDEFNSDSEQFLFEGMKAILPDYLTSTSSSRKSINTEKATALMTMLSCLQKQPMKLLQMITN